MKNLYTKALLILISIAFVNCEDVIEVDLNTSEAKLVIDASLDWEKGTPGNVQSIRISTTSDYYAQNTPAVSGAQVRVSTSTGGEYVFEEMSELGTYTCSNFEPIIDETYTLEIIVNGQQYLASDTLKGSPSLENIVQNNEGGITGDDIEISASFQDNGSEENYYLSSFKAANFPFPEFQLDDDEFFQGNAIPVVYFNEDLASGEVVTISLYSISENYYNYFNKVISAAGNDGGPFQTTPATARGNIVNQTDFDNFPYGYFRVTEVDQVIYEIE